MNFRYGFTNILKGMHIHDIFRTGPDAKLFFNNSYQYEMCLWFHTHESI